MAMNMDNIMPSSNTEIAEKENTKSFDALTSAKINPGEIDNKLNEEEQALENKFDEEFAKYHDKVNTEKPPEKPIDEESPKENTELTEEKHEEEPTPKPVQESVEEKHEEEPTPNSTQEEPKQIKDNNPNVKGWQRKANATKEKVKNKVRVVDSTSSQEGDVKVEMTNNPKKISKKELEEHTKEMKTKLVDNIKQVESTGDYLKINNISDYYEGSDQFREMFGFVLNLLFVPSEHKDKFSATDIIHEITKFDHYNPYDSPDTTLQHNIANMYVIINRLNEIFGFQFINFEKTNNSPLFSDIDIAMANFMHDNANIATTQIEYMMLKSFLGKLIITLSTSTERSFKSDNKIYVDSTFKKAIFNDILQLDRMQDTKAGKLYNSWKHFQEELFGMVHKNVMYKFKSYQELNETLAKAYNVDFQVECLLANMLKTYVPSIALNYFYVIKTIYILCRLFGIYYGKKLYDGKSLEEIMSDLKIIVNSAIILYECKGYMLKQVVRSIPSIEDDEAGLSQQSQAYFLSHLLTGPQYYLLKQLEHVFPVIANKLNILNLKNNK